MCNRGGGVVEEVYVVKMAIFRHKPSLTNSLSYEKIGFN